ncbi:MAG: type I restriction endonuclease subunit R, partial [Candidatus Omnitrophica bacterium]|nr:type I restriction endonuclease subunit R [Candidatus Omnitrophota bacterium]
MSSTITETALEESTLSWLEGMGYEVIQGPTIAPGEAYAERGEWSDVVLRNRLFEALSRLNPEAPAQAIDEAIRKVLVTSSPSLIENNHQFHRFLVDGVDVEYQNREGRNVHDKVWLVDFEEPENNDWLAVNQFTVIENNRNRRPDVVIFVNGLPLGVIELKNPTDEKATIWAAFNQIQTYKNQIPSLFTFNEVLVISDGMTARIGSLTANKERFMPWRTIEGEELAPKTLLELEVLLRGVFDKGRFLDLIRHFVVFEADGGKTIKKLAGYHQFHAVRSAVRETVEAAREEGDQRAGVVWHTQGSGKSLTMVF